MKKRIPLLFSLLSCFIFAIGCEHDNPEPTDTPVGMLSPHVTSFGSFISWDEVPEAAHYEVYRDEALVSTVTETVYRIGELDADSNYYITAVDEKGKKADPSNKVSVSKNVFNQSEILDLSGSLSYSGSIKSDTRKILIGGERETYVILDLCLEKREYDLVIEINNAEIVGSIYTLDGSYKRTDNDYNVIFEVNGNCSIKGAEGSDGEDFSDSIYDNREIDAGSGGDGGGALLLPSVVVCGGGSLTVKGGDGGDGGVGSSTTKWEAVNGPGAGADGGDGGYAVKCSYLAIDMDKADCSVGFYDGVGGKKGKPGFNGSIVTGPMASAMWKDEYDIGKDGKDGKSVLSRKMIINGMLNT